MCWKSKIDDLGGIEMRGVELSQQRALEMKGI